MLIRFIVVLGLVLVLETVVFLFVYPDLIALRAEPAALAREGAERVQDLAGSTLSRRHLTRQHLETLAATTGRAGLLSLEVASLQRLHGTHPSDDAVALRLADAYRRAGRLDDAAALYQSVIERVR